MRLAFALFVAISATSHVAGGVDWNGGTATFSSAGWSAFQMEFDGPPNSVRVDGLLRSTQLPIVMVMLLVDDANRVADHQTVSLPSIVGDPRMSSPAGRVEVDTDMESSTLSFSSLLSMGRLPEGSHRATVVLLTNADEAHGDLSLSDGAFTNATEGFDSVFADSADFGGVAFTGAGTAVSYSASKTIETARPVFGLFNGDMGGLAMATGKASWAGPESRGACTYPGGSCSPIFPISGPPGGYEFRLDYGASAGIAGEPWVLVAEVTPPS